MKTSRYTESQIIAILRKAEGGVPVAELCREHGMMPLPGDASFYKWRAKYGGMDASLISQMKSMEEENRRLKRMYADLSMQADLLKEALGKSDSAVSTPRDGRGAVARRGASIALACRAFGVSETCYRYGPKLKAENEEIADLLVRLTDARKTWGFGLCFLHLRNVKGHPWNRACLPSTARWS